MSERTLSKAPTTTVVLTVMPLMNECTTPFFEFPLLFSFIASFSLVIETLSLIINQSNTLYESQKIVAMSFRLTSTPMSLGILVSGQRYSKKWSKFSPMPLSCHWVYFAFRFKMMNPSLVPSNNLNQNNLLVFTGNVQDRRGTFHEPVSLQVREHSPHPSRTDLSTILKIVMSVICKYFSEFLFV